MPKIAFFPFNDLMQECLVASAESGDDLSLLTSFPPQALEQKDQRPTVLCLHSPCCSGQGKMTRGVNPLAPGHTMISQLSDNMICISTLFATLCKLSTLSLQGHQPSGRNQRAHAHILQGNKIGGHTLINPGKPFMGTDTSQGFDQAASRSSLLPSKVHHVSDLRSGRSERGTLRWGAHAQSSPTISLH